MLIYRLLKMSRKINAVTYSNVYKKFKLNFLNNYLDELNKRYSCRVHMIPKKPQARDLLKNDYVDK